MALAELLREDELPDGLAIHLDTYSVADETAAVLLFRQFDARKSARSKEDISGAYQCFQPALRDCNRSVLMRAAEGITWFRREVQQYGDRRRHPDNPTAVAIGDDVYMIFDEKFLHGFFLMIDEVLKTSKANELKNVPVPRRSLRDLAGRCQAGG